MYRNRSHSHRGSDKLARDIGWLSIGLGLFQLAAPHRVARTLGLEREGADTVIRTCGARSLLTGFGALMDNPRPALWARIGGDALDLAALAAILADRSNPQRENVKLAFIGVGAFTTVSLYCAQAQRRRHVYQGGRTPDYSGRSGFPRGVAQARGAASSSAQPRPSPALPSPARSPGARLPAAPPPSASRRAE